MKDVEISLNSTHIKPNEQILGNIKVNYTGRYDGIVINTHHTKSSMKNNTAEFTSASSQKKNTL